MFNLFIRYTLKQHFYEQRQAKIDKKWIKCLATPWDWIFAIWKLLTFFINVIIQKYPLINT